MNDTNAAQQIDLADRLYTVGAHLSGGILLLEECGGFEQTDNGCFAYRLLREAMSDIEDLAAACAHAGCKISAKDMRPTA
ncbi:MAG TPA: hypothetical protein PKA20_05740 [Burkholderiaceae bacterium]|nr:hypothetical protein [Burkholderiaceae bacterium]